MTRFEILYVLISIIVAFAVTDIASSWGALLRRRASVRFYWIHIAWTVLIVLLVIQLWWGMWTYHDIDDWSFFKMAAIVGETLLLVLTASVITPAKHYNEPIDLQAFFYEVSPIFFTLSALLMLALALVNLILAQQALLSIENAVRAIAISIAMLGATTRSTIVHTVLVSSGFALLVFFILLQVTR